MVKGDTEPVLPTPACRAGWCRAAGGRRAASGRRNAGGFTVVELLICLALMGMMAAIAGLEISRLRAEWQLRAAALQVVGELIRARAAAPGVSRGAAVRVEGQALAVRVGAGLRRVGLPEGVEATLNSGGEVRFSSSGLAENATFRLHNRAGDRLVVVNQRGRIRVQ